MSDQPANPLLTDSQRSIIGFALTFLALLGSAALCILALILMARLLGYFSGVIWPLAVAGVLALILRPLVELFERRLRLRRLISVVLLYGIFVLLVTAGLVVVVPPLVDQCIDFIAYLPALWADVTGYMQQHYPAWVSLARRQMANPSVRQVADSITSEGRTILPHAVPSLRAAFGGAFDVFAFFAHLAIIPVYLFFFLLMRGKPTQHLSQHLPFLRPGVRDDVVYLASEFVSVVEAFFRGQLLIGCCMGVLFAIGFNVIGLKFGLFVGLAMGVLNIVPYLGTIIGLSIALPLAFFQPVGGWHLVGMVLVVEAIVQCIEGWVLTPKIMGHHTGLHPAAIIFAVFFWGTAFGGLLGMLLAVPLTAFFVTLWRLAKRKYFHATDAP